MPTVEMPEMRRFLLRARSRDGIHVKLEILTGPEGFEAKAGEVTFSAEEWKAFHVMLIAGENKYGHLLNASVDVDFDEAVNALL